LSRKAVGPGGPCPAPRTSQWPTPAEQLEVALLKRAPGVLLVFALCLPLALPQQAPDKISIHISDTLVNILHVLSREHSLPINGTRELADAFVELDLEDASPLEVVTAICKQVGAVYDYYEGAQYWAVRPGDWDADCRPQVQLGEYTVFVESAEAHHSRTLMFRWGQETAEANDAAGLKIRLRVKAKTDAARVGLAGIWREGSAVGDNGEVIQTTFRASKDTPLEYSIAPMEPGLAFLTFPAPSEAVQLLKELRGKLLLFREVIPAHCEFTPEEVGVTKALGDDDCKLVKWQEVDEDIVIAVQRPSAGWEPSGPGQGSLTASLLGIGGEGASRRGWGRKQHGNILTQTYRFARPEWEIEKFVIEGFIRREAEEFLEFIIPDVRLP